MLNRRGDGALTSASIEGKNILTYGSWLRVNGS